MVHLPAEIIDKISGHLIEYHKSEKYPFTDWGHWQSNGVYWGDIISAEKHAANSLQARLHESIFSLRLAAHEWNRGIAPLIAKYTQWRVKLDSEESKKRVLACLGNSFDRLIPLPEIVRLLVIKPGDTCFKTTKEFDTRDSKQNIESFLLEIFHKFNCVESLMLSYPFEVSGRYDSDGPKNYGLEGIDVTVEAVRRVLCDTNVLNQVTSLRLRIPGTYHAGRILGAITGEGLAQMRHLEVVITDATGMSGSRDYLQASYFEEEDMDGTAEEPYDEDAEDPDHEDFPRSEVQRAYPNRHHQQELWDFVASCTNLESLSVHGTHFLDLDKINWQEKTGFRGLRCLHLARIYSSAPSIIKLLRPSDGSTAPQLQRIILNEVKIPEDGGMWGDLATYVLSECPDVDLAYLYNLNYFDAVGHRAGLSSPEDGTIVDSSDDADWNPIHALIKRMTKKHGKKDSWPYWLSELADSVDWEALHLPITRPRVARAILLERE